MSATKKNKYLEPPLMFTTQTNHSLTSETTVYWLFTIYYQNPSEAGTLNPAHELLRSLPLSGEPAASPCSVGQLIAPVQRRLSPPERRLCIFARLLAFALRRASAISCRSARDMSMVTSSCLSFLWSLLSLELFGKSCLPFPSFLPLPSSLVCLLLSFLFLSTDLSVLLASFLFLSSLFLSFPSFCFFAFAFCFPSSFFFGAGSGAGCCSVIRQTLNDA